MKECVEEWIRYKKEKKYSYTPLGLKKCISRLQNLCGGDPYIAQQIVDNSMANGYSGLFPLKNKQVVRKNTMTPSEEIFNHNFNHLQSLFDGGEDVK